jgi:ribonuclease P protein component
MRRCGIKINDSSDLFRGYFCFQSMKEKKQYRLGAAQRLKSRKQIERLFSQGQRFAVFPIRVLYELQQAPAIPGNRVKAGFAVSSRNFKKAVDRNRIKRLLREGYRLEKLPLETALTGSQKKLDVFFVFTGKELPEYLLIKEKLAVILKKLINLVNENNIANT